MTTIYRSAVVPFSPQQMFELVNDIEEYPSFLSWCPKASILNQNHEEIEATLHFAKGGWSQAFTTINRLTPSEKVQMRLKEGPFSHLEGIWLFESLANGGCQVSLNLSFEFSSKLVSFVAGPIFQQMASTLVDAFTQRAHQIYATHTLA